MTHVLLVSGDFYSTEDLACALEKRGVTTSCVYRDYHFDRSLEGVDVVVTDGTCKTRGVGDQFPYLADDGESHQIWYDKPREVARRKHVPLVQIFPSGGITPPQWIITRRVRRIMAAASR